MVLLLGLGAFLGHLQTQARTAGRVDPISNVLQKTIDPLAFPLTRGFAGFADFMSGMFRGQSLVRQNQRLKSQMIALEAYDDRVAFLDAQIDQLRAQLQLPPTNRKPISADVIGVSQMDQTILLDAGTEKGIKPDLAVVNGDGLVGIVQTVSAGQSRVSLLTAYGIKVGGLDASRKPPENGLVSGLGESNLTMLMFTPKASVNLGDLVMTGGQSENIPAGLSIGRVISVEDDASYGTRRLTIDPSVNVGLLHEVEVLK